MKFTSLIICFLLLSVTSNNSLPHQLIKLQEYLHSNTKPLPLSIKKRIYKNNKLTVDNNNESKPPIWPLQFNSTLIKITPFDHNIQWTKLYYDYKNQWARFDFVDYYYDMDNQWGPINETILWSNTTVYFIEPQTKQCKIRSRNLPLISPKWLSLTTFKESIIFRGLYANVWEFPNDIEELAGMKYIHRVAQSDDEKIPLRSTNQSNDPGATDYVDFIVGPSDKDLFYIPSYCPK
ncbi:hypothetical protein ABK040_007298 [Willaertia magna]